ncbi:LysR family transcriptional regulator [Amycolatopsis rubida]|uniref:LysR family transcriptional regulator n=1 Tax=Amycolatopsis rubida TaxID=112413 RepID=A0ABX0BP79_9PSEU|nr:LysR substrate-binding domain-containing protein [Amycolatopsis sp. M39]MYW89680.1 LysR family transcriptional regulator [Amycolatopsis rubida]NEC54656.1 LysR family transcriptional regulator [Amycolatopsis rubida]OAP23537.1 Hca operon transcriptional activator [Amycolatopsis sp. M39]
MADRPDQLIHTGADLELRQLKLLVAVAEAGGVAAAAAALGTTPAKLALRIRRLERMVGAALLAAEPAGKLFTETGELLLEHASAVVPQFDRMLTAARAGLERPAAQIRIGSVPTPLLPRLIREVGLRNPDAGLAIRTGESAAELAEALLREELDLGLLRQDAVRERPLEWVSVATEPLVVGIPPGHPLGVPDSLTPAALSGRRCVLLDQTVQPRTRALLAAFADAGADPRLCYADSEWAVLCLGHGAGILTVTAPPTRPMPDTAYRPLHCAATNSTLVLAWADDGPLAGCVPRVRAAMTRAHAEHLRALVQYRR